MVPTWPSVFRPGRLCGFVACRVLRGFNCELTTCAATTWSIFLWDAFEDRDLKNLQASSEIIPEISRDIKPYALHMHFACHDRTNRRVPSGIWLQAQFAGRLVHKDYVCLCEGSSLGSVPSRCGWHAANDSESVESLLAGVQRFVGFALFFILGMIGWNDWYGWYSWDELKPPSRSHSSSIPCPMHKSQGAAGTAGEAVAKDGQSGSEGWSLVIIPCLFHAILWLINYSRDFQCAMIANLWIIMNVYICLYYII